MTAILPTIDVLIVLYRSDRFLRGLFETIGRLSIPVKLYVLDNGSSNDTADKVIGEFSKLPFPAYFFRSLSNKGFARGVNLLARQGSGEFLFLLNPDTELEDACLERLVARAQSDSIV